jgi:hypothetical protein
MTNPLRLLLFSATFIFFSTEILWAQEDKPVAIYIGTSPCGNILKPFLGVANEPDCDFTRWTITLYPQKDNAPALVRLVYQYGVSRPNTTGFMNEKKAEFEGYWTIQKGTKTKPDANIYQLTLHKTDKNLLFVQLSENVIHLLDSQRTLMIGNAGYSYTFSKQKPQ